MLSPFPSDTAPPFDTAPPSLLPVLRAPTGSGKSIAYLVPLLAAIEPTLQQRATRTCDAVADLDLSPTAALSALAPALSSGVPGRGEETAATRIGGGDGQALVPKRGSPLAVVLVPRDALAEQTAAVVYSLLGGYARATRTWQPGASDSLFKYLGPKGGRVCVLRGNSDTNAMDSVLNDCDVRPAPNESQSNPEA